MEQPLQPLGLYTLQQTVAAGTLAAARARRGQQAVLSSDALVDIGSGVPGSSIASAPVVYAIASTSGIHEPSGGTLSATFLSNARLVLHLEPPAVPPTLSKAGAPVARSYSRVLRWHPEPTKRFTSLALNDDGSVLAATTADGFLVLVPAFAMLLDNDLVLVKDGLTPAGLPSLLARARAKAKSRAADAAAAAAAAAAQAGAARGAAAKTRKGAVSAPTPAANAAAPDRAALEPAEGGDDDEREAVITLIHISASAAGGPVAGAASGRSSQRGAAAPTASRGGSLASEDRPTACIWWRPAESVIREEVETAALRHRGRGAMGSDPAGTQPAQLQPHRRAGAARPHAASERSDAQRRRSSAAAAAAATALDGARAHAEDATGEVATASGVAGLLSLLSMPGSAAAGASPATAVGAAAILHGEGEGEPPSAVEALVQELGTTGAASTAVGAARSGAAKAPSGGRAVPVAPRLTAVHASGDGGGAAVSTSRSDGDSSVTAGSGGAQSAAAREAGLASASGRFVIIGFANGRVAVVDTSLSGLCVTWTAVVEPGVPITAMRLFADVASLRQHGLWRYGRAVAAGAMAIGKREVAASPTAGAPFEPPEVIQFPECSVLIATRDHFWRMTLETQAPPGTTTSRQQQGAAAAAASGTSAPRRSGSSSTSAAGSSISGQQTATAAAAAQPSTRRSQSAALLARLPRYSVTLFDVTAAAATAATPALDEVTLAALGPGATAPGGLAVAERNAGGPLSLMLDIARVAGPRATACGVICFAATESSVPSTGGRPRHDAPQAPAAAAAAASSFSLLSVFGLGGGSSATARAAASSSVAASGRGRAVSSTSVPIAALPVAWHPLRLRNSPRRSDVAPQLSPRGALVGIASLATQRYRVYDPTLGDAPLFELMLSLGGVTGGHALMRASYARILRQQMLRGLAGKPQQSGGDSPAGLGGDPRLAASHGDAEAAFALAVKAIVPRSLLLPPPPSVAILGTAEAPPALSAASGDDAGAARSAADAATMSSPMARQAAASTGGRAGVRASGMPAPVVLTAPRFLALYGDRLVVLVENAPAAETDEGAAAAAVAASATAARSREGSMDSADTGPVFATNTASPSRADVTSSALQRSPGDVPGGSSSNLSSTRTARGAAVIIVSSNAATRALRDHAELESRITALSLNSSISAAEADEPGKWPPASRFSLPSDAIMQRFELPPGEVVTNIERLPLLSPPRALLRLLVTRTIADSDGDDVDPAGDSDDDDGDDDDAGAENERGSVYGDGNSIGDAGEDDAGGAAVPYGRRRHSSAAASSARASIQTPSSAAARGATRSGGELLFQQWPRLRRRVYDASDAGWAAGTRSSGVAAPAATPPFAAALHTVSGAVFLLSPQDARDTDTLMRRLVLREAAAVEVPTSLVATAGGAVARAAFGLGVDAAAVYERMADDACRAVTEDAADGAWVAAAAAAAAHQRRGARRASVRWPRTTCVAATGSLPPDTSLAVADHDDGESDDDSDDAVGAARRSVARARARALRDLLAHDPPFRSDALPLGASVLQSEADLYGDDASRMPRALLLRACSLYSRATAAPPLKPVVMLAATGRPDLAVAFAASAVGFSYVPPAVAAGSAPPLDLTTPAAAAAVAGVAALTGESSLSPADRARLLNLAIACQLMSVQPSGGTPTYAMAASDFHRFLATEVDYDAERAIEAAVAVGDIRSALVVGHERGMGRFLKSQPVQGEAAPQAPAAGARAASTLMGAVFAAVLASGPQLLSADVGALSYLGRRGYARALISSGGGVFVECMSPRALLELCLAAVPSHAAVLLLAEVVAPRLRPLLYALPRDVVRRLAAALSGDAAAEKSLAAASRTAADNSRGAGLKRFAEHLNLLAAAQGAALSAARRSYIAYAARVAAAADVVDDVAEPRASTGAPYTPAQVARAAGTVHSPSTAFTALTAATTAARGGRRTAHYEGDADDSAITRAFDRHLRMHPVDSWFAAAGDAEGDETLGVDGRAGPQTPTSAAPSSSPSATAARRRARVGRGLGFDSPSLHPIAAAAAAAELPFNDSDGDNDDSVSEDMRDSRNADDAFKLRSTAGAMMDAGDEPEGGEDGDPDRGTPAGAHSEPVPLDAAMTLTELYLAVLLELSTRGGDAAERCAAQSAALAAIGAHRRWYRSAAILTLALDAHEWGVAAALVEQHYGDGGLAARLAALRLRLRGVADKARAVGGPDVCVVYSQIAARFICAFLASNDVLSPAIAGGDVTPCPPALNAPERAAAIAALQSVTLLLPATGDGTALVVATLCAVLEHFSSSTVVSATRSVHVTDADGSDPTADMALEDNLQSHDGFSVPAMSDPNSLQRVKSDATDVSREFDKASSQRSTLAALLAAALFEDGRLALQRLMLPQPRDNDSSNSNVHSSDSADGLASRQLRTAADVLITEADAAGAAELLVADAQRRDLKRIAAAMPAHLLLEATHAYAVDATRHAASLSARLERPANARGVNSSSHALLNTLLSASNARGADATAPHDVSTDTAVPPPLVVSYGAALAPPGTSSDESAFGGSVVAKLTPARGDAVASFAMGTSRRDDAASRSAGPTAIIPGSGPNSGVANPSADSAAYGAGAVAFSCGHVVSCVDLRGRWAGVARQRLLAAGLPAATVAALESTAPVSASTRFAQGSVSVGGSGSQDRVSRVRSSGGANDTTGDAASDAAASLIDSLRAGVAEQAVVAAAVVAFTVLRSIVAHTGTTSNSTQQVTAHRASASTTTESHDGDHSGALEHACPACIFAAGSRGPKAGTAVSAPM